MPIGECSLGSQIALRSDHVVRFLKPCSELIVQVGLVPNRYEVNAPSAAHSLPS
jgi:hypothetical protein